MVSGVDETLISSTPIGDVLGRVLPCQSPHQKEIRILTLHDGNHLDSTLYRLEKGWILEFHLGPSLFGKDVELYTNHPPWADVDFDRNKYHKLEWSQGERDEADDKYKDDSCYYARLPIRRAGSFVYYFARGTEKLGSGYFTVSPVLSAGPADDILLLDSIQCQTVLTKCLGPFVEWEDRLRVSKETGYNMIHFTPIQELGGSNSSYSIRDQLRLDPRLSSESCTPTFEDVVELTNKLRNEWGVLCIADIVLNHTANESPWLSEHPECTYNMVTAPHLVPAAILDGHLHVLTNDVANGKLLDRGIPREVHAEEHLQALRSYLESDLIPRLRLHEYYTCDVDKLVAEFEDYARKMGPSPGGNVSEELVLIAGFAAGRNRATVDMELARRIYHRENEEAKKASAENFKNRLCELNSRARRIVDEHLSAAVNNCIANARYHRVEENGPKLREVSEENPLVPRYFTGEFRDFDSVEKVVLENGRLVMAHNGWVMNGDPLSNFAESASNVYLRRELIAWGDSVKLRYGERREDCPFLWDRMGEYVEMTARAFHGVRLDNCHSTPLPVAEYLLDRARKIRPDLYVVAELFTNSDEVDNVFVNRLGITSLIREATSAWNCHELGRLVYRYGGDPVGSFHTESVRPLVPAVAHALLYDVTHDNECPIARKSIFDSLASSALVAAACCATGSTRGFDELVPHKIDVVKETRPYASWTDGDVAPGAVNSKIGLIPAKRRLNHLHRKLNDEGFTQVFVDQVNEDVAAVTRHNPATGESVVVVARTAFSRTPDPDSFVGNLEVEGVCVEILLEAFLESARGDGVDRSEAKEFEMDETYVNGLTEYEARVAENLSLEESPTLRRVPASNSRHTKFEFKRFPPGSVIAVKFGLSCDVASKLTRLRESLTRTNDLREISRRLSLGDLNYALYRCSEEGFEDGAGAYDVPGYGVLVYCGLQGFASVLNDVRFVNDLGHPFCANLRQGDWMLDYVAKRLRTRRGLEELARWMEAAFDNMRDAPRYLIPKYFDLVVTTVTNLLLSRAAFEMSEFVREGSSFVRALAMGSVQCVGSTKNARFPPFSPTALACPEATTLTMSAGLPHFSTGYMRSWGRDTFVSLRGLLLLTGRYEAARCHILAYGGCLRHGLIPNLLDCGTNARYNCRDAVWWWLYSITSYVDLAPDGHDILQDVVYRLYPEDDSGPVEPGVAEQALHVVMQEALTKHFKGLSYRERNAGRSIDANMSDAGFDNSIGVDRTTGFVYGGNEWNCGTWMDKMGSSHAAGNHGRPATPRDGSAVELVGLSKAVLRRLRELHARGSYPYEGVEDENGVAWSFGEWEMRIQENFERSFWVSEEDASNFVHRRGIYKDSVGASHPWADYQLRCNFLIALAVAPEMVHPEKAWTAIKNAEDVLLGPLGMKTLDPMDWNYNGNYANENDSNDAKVAHGFNYHQGPEWVWPVGFFLRAKLHFARARGTDELDKVVKQTRSYLSAHYEELMSSHWRGLPELTNENGAHCRGSCRVQAWSMACLLEVLHDLRRLNAS